MVGAERGQRMDAGTRQLALMPLGDGAEREAWRSGAPEREQAGKWFGLPVTRFRCSLAAARAHVPLFARRPFAVSPGEGHRSTTNERFDVIVRLPDTPDQAEVAVGLVSKQYALVQHQEVIDLAAAPLNDIGVQPEQVWAELELTENGERMALHLYLPKRFDFDPGDGHPIGLRLTCFNSVEGSSKFVAVFGWLRFVCANGMIVGVARANVRETHDRHLQMADVAGVLHDGIRRAPETKRQFETWRRQRVEAAQLARWVDGPLSARWGVLAASRVWHIASTGCDGELVERFEKAPASKRRLRSVRAVPGIAAPVRDAFAACQVLAWLAKQRREIPEQLERMEQIPSLVGALVGTRRRRPREEPRTATR